MKNSVTLKRIVAIIMSLILIIPCFNGLWSDFNDVYASETNEKEFQVVKYEDISKYRESGNYIAPKPLVDSEYNDWIFAGWFTTEDCSTVLNKASGEGWAKFVPAEVLSVKCQTSYNTVSNSPTSDLRLITSVDSLAYREVGFDISFKGKNINAPITSVLEVIHSSKQNVQYPFTPSIFSEASKYFATVTLVDILTDDFDESFFITPYWVTKDGTKVSGIQRYARVEDSYLKIANVPIRAYSDKQINSGTLEVSFNSEVFEIDTTMMPYIECGNVVENVTVQSNKTDSIILSLDNNNTNINADGMLANLRFKIKEGSDMTQTYSFPVTASWKDVDAASVADVVVPNGIYSAPAVNNIDLTLGENPQYYASQSWGQSIGHTSSHTGTTSKQELGNEEYQILRDMGYYGEKAMYRATIEMHKNSSYSDAARSIGIVFPDTLNLDIFNAAKRDYKHAYLSVWVKFSENLRYYPDVATTGQMNAAVFDWDAKKQYDSSSDAFTIPEMKKDTWTEIKIPLSSVVGAYDTAIAYDSEGKYALGIWFKWIVGATDLNWANVSTMNIDIAGGMVQYEEIETIENKDVDLSLDTKILSSDAKYYFDIYSGDTRLKAGTDYEKQGNLVTMKQEGTYIIKYQLMKNNNENQMILCRKLTVKPEFITSQVEYSFATATWQGTISNADDVLTLTEKTLSEKENENLISAGYNGLASDGKVSQIDIDMTTISAKGNKPRSVGIAFSEEFTNSLATYISKGANMNEYYVSIWIKSNADIKTHSNGTTSPMRATIYDTQNRLQSSSGGSYNTPMNIKANTWTELKISLTEIATAYNNFKNGNPNASESMFGLWFMWLVNGDNSFNGVSTLTFEVTHAECKYQAIDSFENKTINLSVDTEFVGNDVNYTYNIYSGDTCLTEGVDYVRENDNVLINKAGTYCVKYVFTNSEQEPIISICRTVRIAPVLSIGLADYYFASATWQGAFNTANYSGATSIKTLDDNEYESLVSAGYSNNISDRIASQINIDMTTIGGNKPRSVGIAFSDTLDNFLSTYANDTTIRDNYYLSIWIKSNADIKTHSNGTTSPMRVVILDTQNKLQSSSGGSYNTPMNIKANTWTELKISLTEIATAYNNFKSGNSNASESMFGLWFMWLVNGDNSFNGVSTLTFEVYGAELRKY